MWISSDTGISKIEITLFTTVAASTAGTYLKIKDIICGFVQTSCGMWIENACFLLAITATKRRNVLYDSYLFEAQLHYFVFHSFPRLPHFPNSSPVFTSVFVLRLVARGPFLERPSNLTGPKSYFEISLKKSRACSDLQ